MPTLEVVFLVSVFILKQKLKFFCCSTWSLGHWLLFQILFSKKKCRNQHIGFDSASVGTIGEDRLPWSTAHRKMTTNSTLQSPWEPLAAWRKGQLKLTKEKWLFSSSGLSVSDTDTSLISDKSHCGYTTVGRKSGEWVMHAGFIDLQEPQNQCLLTQGHFQHKVPGCPWAAGVTLLSLQGQEVPHAWGQDGGSGLDSFSCVLGGWCSRLCCCSVSWGRAAPNYFWSCAQVTSTVPESVLQNLGLPLCPHVSQHSTEWRCKCALSLCRKVIGACGPKGIWTTVLPTGTIWNMKSSDTACAPSGDKNCLLSFTGS